MVCSDGMARGMDLSCVGTVINFGSPRTFGTYLHRAGRTARAGRKGVVYTLLSSHEVYTCTHLYQQTRPMLYCVVVLCDQNLTPKFNWNALKFGYNSRLLCMYIQLWMWQNMRKGPIWFVYYHVQFSKSFLMNFIGSRILPSNPKLQSSEKLFIVCTWKTLTAFNAESTLLQNRSFSHIQSKMNAQL